MTYVAAGMLLISLPCAQNICVSFIDNLFNVVSAIELIGTLLLWHQFWAMGIEKPLWSAFFHSVSAFATAGFSIYSDSLLRFQNHGFIILVFAFLCYAGSIGFIVPMDIYRKLSGKSAEITFTTKSKPPYPADFVLIFAMAIGASPSGTGGGIKTTSVSTFSVLF